jgi:hypothetical protein
MSVVWAAKNLSDIWLRAPRGCTLRSQTLTYTILEGGDAVRVGGVRVCKRRSVQRRRVRLCLRMHASAHAPVSSCARARACEWLAVARSGRERFRRDAGRGARSPRSNRPRRSRRARLPASRSGLDRPAPADTRRAKDQLAGPREWLAVARSGRERFRRDAGWGSGVSSSLLAHPSRRLWRARRLAASKRSS